MNEIQLILLGILVLGASVVFFFFTDLVPKQITSTEMNIIVALGVGLLIFIVDKRQDRYLDEIIQTQHKLTQEIHSMITEEMRLINEMRRENNKG
jgi:cadmium resistance protein CadD (predicted permease)